MRIRDYGYTVGVMAPGPLNRISDVPGVTVGHAMLKEDGLNTGVTIVMPGGENPFVYKLPCACHVLNGFGKTLGLVQVEELGTLETPIALTNTLNVGLVHDAMVEYMIERCDGDGIALRSVNPVVCECNDASLSDIRRRAVRREHVFSAIADCRADFEEGAVGCGRGLTCHGLKGGVGSASRVIETGGARGTLGALVQCNHGRLSDFTLNGENVGRRIADRLASSEPDKGSCIVIYATDLPLSDRQLRRVIRRAGVGLARLGSFIGHGSGEVFIGFSTANRVSPDQDERAILPQTAFNERYMDILFRAAAECCEEAVLNAMAAAERVTGPGGVTRYPLNEFLKISNISGQRAEKSL